MYQSFIYANVYSFLNLNMQNESMKYRNGVNCYWNYRMFAMKLVDELRKYFVGIVVGSVAKNANNILRYRLQF